MDNEKKVALKKVVSALCEKYGDGTISVGGGTLLSIKRQRSGIIALDLGIGGGIPRGSIIEFFGRESGGKTATALKTVAAYQEAGLTCAWVDSEHSFDPAWASILGVDPDNLLISQPESLERAVDVIETLVKSNTVDLIVYDSLAASLPMEEADKSTESLQVGLQARLFSKMCRKITAALQPENLNDQQGHNLCTVIFINQVREKVGQIHAHGYETPGGHAVKHASRARVQFNRGLIS